MFYVYNLVKLYDGIIILLVGQSCWVYDVLLYIKCNRIVLGSHDPVGHIGDVGFYGMPEEICIYCHTPLVV